MIISLIKYDITNCILVSAPTNVAVGEVCKRLISCNFFKLSQILLIGSEHRVETDSPAIASVFSDLRISRIKSFFKTVDADIARFAEFSRLGSFLKGYLESLGDFKDFKKKLSKDFGDLLQEVFENSSYTEYAIAGATSDNMLSLLISEFHIQAESIKSLFLCIQNDIPRSSLLEFNSVLVSFNAAIASINQLSTLLNDSTFSSQYSKSSILTMLILCSINNLNQQHLPFISEFKYSITRLSISISSLLKSLPIIHTWKAEFAKKGLPFLVVSEAKILFCTVNSCARETVQRLFISKEPFVIVDEASQVVEAETLIFLQSPISSLILVGDNKQLPAVVFSSTSTETFYNRSLFERVASFEYPFNMLKTQYRMHPEICLWPNQTFYKSQIENGRNVLEEVYSQSWHLSNHFNPIQFFNISEFFEMTDPSSFSKFNEIEAAICIGILKEIRKLIDDRRVTVGIIAGYAAQVELIYSEIKKTSGFGKMVIDVKSIDGFQGQELPTTFKCSVDAC